MQAGEIGIEYEEGPRAKGAGGGARAAGRAGGESVAILGDLSRAHANCSNENENENALKMHRGMKLKGQWTADEDALLTELVDKYGTTRWSYIARALYGRVGKQCRERWNNHLAPDIKRGAWSVEEEETFIQAHMELGNKWSHIAKRLKGRTENSVKNHWNATRRRKDGTKSRFRTYVLEVHSRDGSLKSPQFKSRSTTPSNSIGSSARKRACASSPSNSTINEEVAKRGKLDTLNSNTSTQDAMVANAVSAVDMKTSPEDDKCVYIDKKRVPALHEPMLFKVPGNTHDFVEVVNCREQMTCDQTKDPGIEVASYTSTNPLPAHLFNDVVGTLNGLIDAVRNHCSVVNLGLSAKSGDEETLKKVGGNCYVISVSSRKWEDAMRGVKLAVEFIKDTDEVTTPKPYVRS